MVPEGWRHAPIKLLCKSIIDCVNKTAPVVDYETPYKMIRTTNVRHGKVDTDNVRYVEAETYKNWVRRGAPKKGDLIFTREAPVGEAGILDSDDSVFLGQRTMMYRADPSKSSNLFLFYSLQTRFCQKQIEDFSNGGTVAHMRVPDCGEIIVRVPPLPEQEKIAKILSTWDRAIAVTEKLLKNSQQQKKALMQQLLTGTKRFLGFGREWKEYRLEEIFTFKKGKSLSKAAVSNKGKNKCILYGELYTRYSEVIKNVISYTNSHDGTKSVAGDVLIPSSTTTSGVDLANATAIMEDGVLLGGDINILRPNTGLVNSSFIAHLLTHIKKHDIAKRAQGITIIHLYGSDLKHLTVSLPELKAQEKISKILADTKHEIEILEQKLNCLRQEKRALMQQLLTGKRRVKVDEEEISLEEAARA